MFKRSEVDRTAEGGFFVFPPGEYDAKVGECEWVESDWNDGQMKTRFQVKHEGKVRPLMLWTTHTKGDGSAHEPGRRAITELAEACNAINGADEPDPSAMEGNIVRIRLSRFTMKKTGKDRNGLDGASPPEGTAQAPAPKPDPTEGMDGDIPW